MQNLKKENIKINLYKNIYYSQINKYLFEYNINNLRVVIPRHRSRRLTKSSFQANKCRHHKASRSDISSLVLWSLHL